MPKSIFEYIVRQQKDRRPFALATVIETRGSVSARTSAKALINDQGRLVCGWVGGGCAESTTISKALECMENGATALLDIDLDDEMLGAGMPCGGSMRVYIEAVLPAPTLWIMGHGRVAETLCLLGGLLGLRVVVNDPAIEREKYPAADVLIDTDPDYSRLDPARDDYVVIATQHKGDHESIQRALASEAAYIALIASRKRSGLVLDYLRETGASAADIRRIMAPAGLDLGARTPEEIALCVMSEITLLRRGGSGLRMRDKLQREARHGE